MNKQKHGESPYCCFHPREVVVGVCAHCLKDRLLLVLSAAAAGDATQAAAGLRRRGRGRSSSISLPKVLALGSSFLQRLDSRHHRPADPDDDPAAAAAESDDGGSTSASAASLDDSFISIKFEDNGKATWDSSNIGKQQQQPPVMAVVVAEHGKRGGVTRWRKQVVGRLLQLARWKRSAADGKKNTTSITMKEGQRSSKAKQAKQAARGSWIRRTLTLTRRRAADHHRPSCSS